MGRARIGAHTLISSSCNSHLSVRVDLAAPVGRVRIGNGLLQAWSSLGRAVLIALHPVEGLLGCIEDEIWWVVAKEALAHVHDRLNGRGSGSFIDDGPTSNQQATHMIM